MPILPTPTGFVRSMLQSFFRESVGPVQGVLTLVAIAVVSLALAARAVERREYVLEQ